MKSALVCALLLAVLLPGCANPPKRVPSIYDVDNTILTPEYEFNHYRGDPAKLYHRNP